MAQQRVDYDRIGKRYDEERVRQREVDPELLKLCEERGSGDGAGISVLDVGCGTGIQLLANQARLPRLEQWGVDLHQAMLEAAREKSGAIRWLHGNAADLPFQDQRFDFVSAQFCFHHVQDKPGLLREVARVLKPGAVFALLNMTPWRMRDWEVYRYFPEAFARDERDFWPEEQLAEQLAALGLEVAITHREHRDARDLRARLEFYRQRYSPSQLVALTDREFAEGIERIESELRVAGGAPIESVNRVCLVTITARKS